MKLKKYIIIQMMKVIKFILLIILVCSNMKCQDGKNFDKSLMLYLKTINEQKLDSIKSILGKFPNKNSPDNFIISLPDAMDFSNYSEFGIKYKLDKQTFSILKKELNFKCSIKLDKSNFSEKFINNILMYKIKDCNAFIPEIDNNLFYIRELDKENTEIFILDYGNELIFKKQFLSETQQNKKIMDIL